MVSYRIPRDHLTQTILITQESKLSTAMKCLQAWEQAKWTEHQIKMALVLETVHLHILK